MLVVSVRASAAAAPGCRRRAAVRPALARGESGQPPGRQGAAGVAVQAGANLRG